ncbi:MlaD family protein, partial [Escherichia coli]|uniref:MlaD family protein n=1 Tax=Escherichia coli TaxID=562 RepID=UPI00390C80D3
PLSDKLPGLHLTLKADRLGSLEQGSPVFYRQIQVGQVKSFQLGDDQRTNEIEVHNEPDRPPEMEMPLAFQNRVCLRTRSA